MIHHHIIKKIKHLRTKPDHVKQRIVFFVMAFFVVIILGAWIVTFNPNFSDVKKLSPYVENIKNSMGNTSTSIVNIDSDSSAFFGEKSGIVNIVATSSSDSDISNQ